MKKLFLALGLVVILGAGPALAQTSSAGSPAPETQEAPPANAPPLNLVDDNPDEPSPTNVPTAPVN